MTESFVEEQVKARIAAARRRTEDMRRQRAELAAARKRGLAHRHAAKLRNQASARTTDGTATPTGGAANDRGPAGTSVEDSPSPANPHGADDHAAVGQPPTAVGHSPNVAALADEDEKGTQIVGTPGQPNRGHTPTAASVNPTVSTTVNTAGVAEDQT